MSRKNGDTYSISLHTLPNAQSAFFGFFLSFYLTELQPLQFRGHFWMRMIMSLVLKSDPQSFGPQRMWNFSVFFAVIVRAHSTSWDEKNHCRGYIWMRIDQKVKIKICLSNDPPSTFLSFLFIEWKFVIRLIIIFDF